MNDTTRQQLVTPPNVEPSVNVDDRRNPDALKPVTTTHDVEVTVDYISADEPIHGKFAPDTMLAAIKTWAREHFVPVPPSDKTFYLNDDKTRHRFTAAEEQKTLAELGYRDEAKLRLNEEQSSGRAMYDCDISDAF